MGILEKKCKRNGNYYIILGRYGVSALTHVSLGDRQDHLPAEACEFVQADLFVNVGK